MEINYNIRALLDEKTEDDDVNLVQDIINKNHLKVDSICEIPCQKGRNLKLCNYFNKVIFADINPNILNYTRQINNSTNAEYMICDINNISSINAELILTTRLSLQMFSKTTIYNFLRSAKQNNFVKYVLFDLYYFQPNDDYKELPYLSKNMFVREINTNEIFIRESSLKFKKNYVILCHTYKPQKSFQNYEHKIKLYNYTFLEIESLLNDMNITYQTILCSNNLRRYFIEVK